MNLGGVSPRTERYLTSQEAERLWLSVPRPPVLLLSPSWPSGLGPWPVVSCCVSSPSHDLETLPPSFVFSDMDIVGESLPSLSPLGDFCRPPWLDSSSLPD